MRAHLVSGNRLRWCARAFNAIRSTTVNKRCHRPKLPAAHTTISSVWNGSRQSKWSFREGTHIISSIYLITPQSQRQPAPEPLDFGLCSRYGCSNGNILPDCACRQASRERPFHNLIEATITTWSRAPFNHKAIAVVARSTARTSSVRRSQFKFQAHQRQHIRNSCRVDRNLRTWVRLI